MTLSEQDLADLTSRLATTVVALAGTAADTATAQAGLDATRAATEKTRAEAEQVRASTEQARTAAADAHQTALVARATAAVPDLSAVKASAVTFGSDAVLHQGEGVARALASVADQVAAAVVAARLPDGVPVWVTATPDLVRTTAGYLQLAADAERVRAALSSAVDAAQVGDVHGLVDANILAAVVGTAVTQLASLFELTVAVGTARGTVPARGVQAAVIGGLVAVGRPVEHDTVRVVSSSSPLLGVVHEVVQLRQRAGALGDVLDAEIAAQTPKPAAGSASGPARTSAPEGANPAPVGTSAPTGTSSAPADAASAPAGKPSAPADADAALLLAALKTRRADLTRAAGAADALAAALAVVDATSGLSALAGALAVEPLVASPAEDRAVLSLGAAETESSQLVVTRRLFPPRVHVSTTVSVDFLLLHGARVVAAGRPAASCTLRARIGGRAVRWDVVPSSGPRPTTDLAPAPGAQGGSSARMS